MTCNKCNSRICINCEVVDHTGSCEAYQKKNNSMINLVDMKRCYHCNKNLTKLVGCNHLDCPGSYPHHAFCFTCQGPYPLCFCLKYDKDKPRINQDCPVCLTLIVSMTFAQINEAHKSHAKTLSEAVPECRKCTGMWQKGIPAATISLEHRTCVKKGLNHE